MVKKAKKVHKRYKVVGIHFIRLELAVCFIATKVMSKNKKSIIFHQVGLKSTHDAITLACTAKINGVDKQ